ncbi:MAG: T9SS type A sorting domain-containing protein [Bacteroidota bacterium]
MKACVIVTFSFTISFFAALMLHHPLHAQVDPEDPFRGNYLLGENGEIVVVSGGNGNANIKIIDAVGDVTEGGLSEVNSQFVEAPWGIYGNTEQVDLVTGDFNDDGFEEFIGVWPGPDSTVTLFIPEMDPNTFSWTNAIRKSVQDDAFPKLKEEDSFPFGGWIRAVSGQFDDDNEPELLVAYWADTGDPEGGPIQIIVYDTDGSLTPQPSANIANRSLSPFIADGAGNLRYSSRFDISTGDFDGDGTDEIFLVYPEPGPVRFGYVGWQMVASIYDFDNGQLIETMNAPVTSRFGDPIEYSGNANEFIQRLGIASGDFNGDFKDDIALAWDEGKTNEAILSLALYTIDVSADLESFTTTDRQSEGGWSSRGENGHPLSIIGRDLNLDGADEILVYYRNSVRIFEPDESLGIGSSVERVSVSTREGPQYHRAVAITDVDIADSDSLRMEVVTMGRSGTKVWQNSTDTDDFNIGGTGSEYTASAPVYGVALAVGDFDGDAVRLGPPSRQTVTDITQPLVVLNAPPIHYDIIDGVTYDINKCFDADFRINCEHRSIYENATSSDSEVRTQISSDWGVSKSIEAEAGADFKFVQASVKGSLGRKYGEGFSNVEGSSETVSVKVTSDAIEEDRIYATVSNYDILEYPVYAENTRQGSVIAVVPQLKGLESLQNTWMGTKSGNARDYIPDHEVGNILSYRSQATLPDSAIFFGNGSFEGGGGDTWELSGNATQTWELRFGSENISQRENRAYQQVSRSLEANVSGNYGPFRASLTGKVSDQYDDQQISTHKTTVREESALMVEFGTIDDSILGNKTYSVSPYVYWASNGALVLDYAVSPDMSMGVASWWALTYGNAPDLTMNLPWKYDAQKGIGSTDPEVQREETRDIIFDPVRPEPGEKVTISARIQNYSMQDYNGRVNVAFYLGDPRSGGELLMDQNGNTQFEIEQISARQNGIVNMAGWTMPEGVNGNSKIYVVIDEENDVDEVQENNNIAWALVNPELGMATSAEEKLSERPVQHRLYQNYPNPFNPSTTIGFELGTAERVALDVYDITGRKVAELIDGPMSAGYHTVRFDGSRLSSGVYFYRLTANNFVQTRRLVLVK